jgi:L,D-transpeptidase ErfK/SrfK
MRGLASLLILMLTVIAWPGSAAAQGATLYQLVTGGEEEFVVEKSQGLIYLARIRGLRPWVLAKQTKLGVNAGLKPGAVLKFDTSHIVPTEVSHGLVVNLPELLVYQFHKGVYQRRYAVAVGKPSWPTPTGSYTIVDKRENPTWNVPESIQEEMEEMGMEVIEKVPPGPNNPLGKYWIGTSAEGVGLHATNRPWSVGQYVSHGCMRMLPDEIAQLFPQVDVGAPIKIIYQPVKMALTSQGRIFLEAHPNIYDEKFNYLEYIKNLSQSHQLDSRIDWQKVDTVLKIKEGLARDITKEPAPAKPATTYSRSPRPRELGLSTLQLRDTHIE